ncbi:DUF6868 family protein [Mariprofundus sp. EBB-1]|uniref:DUF6868 family protein n=1 Tax=Mariprofundus sp. EBB-1 TaxID=2650971 RepID=UPI0019138FAB
MLRVFFGWCSVINIGVLGISAICIMLFRQPIARMHASMFSMAESDLSQAYFQYLAQFKIAVIVFNIVPYFALRIMT